MFFIQGFLLSISVIAAIGAQNSMLLTAGIKKQPIAIYIIIFACADTLLMGVGIFATHLLQVLSPNLMKFLSVVAIIFLLAYGFFALWRVFFNKNYLQMQRKPNYKVAFAVTFLNPHVYLDTLLLIAMPSALFTLEQKMHFYGGAVSASWIWFIFIGVLARLLSPLLQSKGTWRIIDCLVAMIMFWVAYSVWNSTLF